MFAQVHGCPHRWFTVLNPDFEEQSEKTEKWIKVFIRAKGTKGMNEIVQRGRIVVLKGQFREWTWNDTGKVFVANSIESISYEHIKPKNEQLTFEEYEW